MLGLSRLRRPLLAMTVLWSSAQVLGESTDMTMDDPRLARTVTERPFEVVIDRRACGTRGVYVQVLGAGADDLGDAQASSGYLVWVDGKARVLIDMGTGSALRFEESGADFKDLYAVGLSQLHVEHSADLPAFLQGAANIRRKEDLPLFGPAPGEKTLGLKTWTSRLLGPNGAYPHLADYFSPFSQGASKYSRKKLKAPIAAPGGASAAMASPFRQSPRTTAKARALPGAWTWARWASPSRATPGTAGKR